MILYHERCATKGGSKRVEVQVEEVQTSKGPRYVVFAFLAPALSQAELKQEWLYSERERAVRASLAWFDAQVKELFADVPEGQMLGGLSTQEPVEAKEEPHALQDTAASGRWKYVTISGKDVFVDDQKLGQPVNLECPFAVCMKHSEVILPQNSCTQCMAENPAPQPEPPPPEKVEFAVQFRGLESWPWQDEKEFPPARTPLELELLKLRLSEWRKGFFKVVDWRILKRTTCGENVTEEVIDA